jgi:formate-dependent nitrite reductase membrane component NrfD
VSTADVTGDGPQGARPEREATTGVDHDPVPGRERARKRAGRGGRGAGSMVPEPQFQSYYGRPIINAPVWQARDIAGYLFLGGLAGASSVLAAGAHATDRPQLARTAKLGALGAIGLSFVALIHDLGRPLRFVNMLRVFKPSSPMNLGTWLLSCYAPAAGTAAIAALTGRAPRTGAVATAGAAALGPAVATYTAVLLADTAVPAWHDAHRELPYVFAASAAGAAAGLGLLGSPIAEAGPARRLAVLATGVELVAVELLTRRLAEVSETYDSGRAGVLMRAAKLLSVTGTAVALGGRRRRMMSGVGGAALLGASACTRFGVFAAGMRSAEDPKYTVGPQRRRAAPTAAGALSGSRG